MLKKVRNGNQLHVSLPRNPGTRMHTDTLRGREDNSRDKNERRQTLLSKMQKPSCDKVGQHYSAIQVRADRGTPHNTGDDGAEARVQGLRSRAAGEVAIVLDDFRGENSPSSLLKKWCEVTQNDPDMTIFIKM